MANSFNQLFRHSVVRRIPSIHHEHSAYKWWVLLNVMIGTFMAVLDSTIVNVALPKIMATFGADIDKIEWVVTAYMLVFAVMLPTSGWVADHFGYKRTYFFALLLFTIGSFLCGLAWDENVLIFFRVIQGMGAGFLMPVGMAIVTREFPVEQRGIALGFWSIAAAASVSLGPLVGGYLVDNISWNAIFDVNVPIGIFGMFATYVIQREYKTLHTRSFDMVGFFSMSVFLVALLLALADGNASWNTGGWSSPFITICFTVAVLGLIIFLITEVTVKHPLIDLSLFNNYNFTATNAILFIFGLGMFGSTFLLPLFLQNSLGYTALQAGAVFLPVGILQAMMSPLAGYFSDKINPKIPAIIGLAGLAFSLYLNSELSLFSESNQIFYSLVVRGIAMGLIFTPLSALSLRDIPRAKMAQAAGLTNIIRQVGGSFGVAILSTLLTQRTIYHLAMFGQSVDQYSPVFQKISMNLGLFSRYMIGGSAYQSSARALALIDTHIASQAFVRAVQDDFLVAAFVTSIGLIPVILLRTKRKKGDAKTEVPVIAE